MRHCKECGKQLAEKAKFCDSCGAKLDAPGIVTNLPPAYADLENVPKKLSDDMAQFSYAILQMQMTSASELMQFSTVYMEKMLEMMEMDENSQPSDTEILNVLHQALNLKQKTEAFIAKHRYLFDACNYCLQHAGRESLNLQALSIKEADLGDMASDLDYLEKCEFVTDVYDKLGDFLGGLVLFTEKAIGKLEELD